MRHRSKYRSIPPTTFNLLHSKSTYFYKWWYYLIPSVCILALLVGAYRAINPVVQSNIERVSATDVTDATDGGEDTSLESSLSLTINGNTNEVTPVTADEVAYRSNTFTVSATKYRNYTVFLSGMNGTDQNLHGKNHHDAIITGVGTNVPPINFANNTWGYNFTANNTNTSNEQSSMLTYSTVPAYGSPKNLTEYRMKEDSITHTHKLTFAAKISADSPEDHYENSLILSVAGTPGEIVFDNISTIQNMTSAICKAAQENDTAQLEDTRDHKSYWVTKLKDGT